jgi:hypothetical protein
MKYQVKLKSPAEREATIRAAVNASKEARDFHDFRSIKLQLPLVRVSENILVYRMENFRTYIEQHEYAIREKKPLDFFVTSQENESVQQLQHEILFRLAKQGRADSIVPVIDVLRREKQREPLLITHRGIVVNGNRRLAGMRELLAEDGATYGDFSHIDCIVLPGDATTSEIVDIEAALQAKPETRLDYDWVSDCLLIERLIELGKNVEQVAQKLNRKPSEIKNSLNALAEANLYLKDWAKADGEYSRVVDGGEQLFKDLPSLLQGKDPGLQEASRVIAWNLFENSEKLDGRLYAFNPTFGKQAANVLDRVAADLGVPIEGDSSTDDDSFEVDVDAGAGSLSYQPLIDIFRNPARRDEAVETLIDVCRSVIESERGKKTGQAALKAITAANARLTEADLTRADPETYGAIEKQLEQIAKRVQALQKTVSELKK